MGSTVLQQVGTLAHPKQFDGSYNFDSRRPPTSPRGPRPSGPRRSDGDHFIGVHNSSKELDPKTLRLTQTLTRARHTYMYPETYPCSGPTMSALIYDAYTGEYGTVGVIIRQGKTLSLWGNPAWVV